MPAFSLRPLAPQRPFGAAAGSGWGPSASPVPGSQTATIIAASFPASSSKPPVAININLDPVSHPHPPPMQVLTNDDFRHKARLIKDFPPQH